MAYYRSEVVNLINSWIGLNEKDGSYRKIIDIYNNDMPGGKFPRSVKMQYSWAWCACTWSALAIKLGYTKIMPIEISVNHLMNEAMRMGIWKESDVYIPDIGDAVVYDWDDNGKGDNVGYPDHVGTIVSVNESAGYFVVVEGNYSNSVKKRTMSINGKYIRGFICPKYDEKSKPVAITPSDVKMKTNVEIAHEVIAGDWGSGDERKVKLEAAGYNYVLIQAQVNTILGMYMNVPSDNDQNQPIKKRVTTTAVAKHKDNEVAGDYKTTAVLNLRNDAGTNKKILTKIPKDTTVHCYSYYNTSGNVKWLLVRVILDGIEFTGFCSGAYLKKVK